MAKGLGKGLNAFFTNVDKESEETIVEIKLKEIRPNPYQPRKIFTKESIEELKQSILTHGILQPIIVRKSIKGYEIVVGERRYRAAREANMATMPVIIRDLSEQQMMELAILENLQREDLTPIEEGAAYQLLIEKLNITQEELAKRLGKSRPHIANHIRLLSLPAKVQEMIADGELTMGHGRTLLGLKKKSLMDTVVEKVLKDSLNVRQLEQWIGQLNEKVPRETKKKVNKDVFIQSHESSLRERFGTNVHIKKGKKKGKIEIEFFSNDDLERILDLLDQQKESI
ncbi:ParB/RepB/Spo0J family partition protein [Cytobacillus sp. Sa5YUA1]|uniref:ParB/RepB/Spo0J family partition protein n=1 Tax=Cytobacillus stercorigallinarum TaxID=2762240 RepID=A0ABR8QVL5_9BACI|nr:ParB/RepB/Spo0J family partition protein [Cytobacillus stercorigallinarum]MBD7939586.1 ParB/RepB/Spo0J family partition protein [Cytobacillus stercorigallinarum]